MRTVTIHDQNENNFYRTHLKEENERERIESKRDKLFMQNSIKERDVVHSYKSL